MGCGSSKAVAPAQDAAVAGPLTSSKTAATADAQPTTAAAHKRSLELQQQQQLAGGTSDQQQQQQHNLSLPGRIDSTTSPAPPAQLLHGLPEVHDLPAQHKPPNKADAEFDYSKELQHGAAMGPPRHVFPAGAQHSSGSAHVPDWLQGASTGAAAGPAGHAGTGVLPPLHASTGLGSPAGKASALPPLLPRGLAAAAPSSGSSSLPALVPGGGKSLAPPPQPQHKQQAGHAELSDETQKKKPSHDRDSDAHHPAAASGVSSAAAAAQQEDPSDPWSSLQSQYAATSPSPDNSSPGGLSALGTSSKGPAAAGSSSALPPLHGRGPQAAAAAGVAAVSAAASAGATSAAAAAAAAGASRRATGTVASQQQQQQQELVLAADSEEDEADKDLGPTPGLHAVTHAHMGPNSSELGIIVQPTGHQGAVALNDDGDVSAQHAQHAQHSNAALKAGGSFSSSRMSGGGRNLSAQSSQQSISSSMTPAHTAKSGGWAAGSLAGAGTIMLGGEASRVAGRKPGAQHVGPNATAGHTAAAAGGAAGAGGAGAAHDDVFGDDNDDEEFVQAPVAHHGLAGAALGAEASAGSSSSNVRSSHGRMRVGGAAAAGAAKTAAAAAAAAGIHQEEALAVEELEEDVDALIESEMGRDGLPADLAAKLAQFEALGGEEEEGEGGCSEKGGGSRAESPTIYALMNNKQGTWRAA